jgi:hypothetical protein
MATSIIDEKHENQRLSAILAKWMTVGFFCLVFLLPLFQAGFISTTSNLSAGRLGLILPVILLADDQVRWLLARLFLVTFFNLFWVSVVGIWLGCSTGKCRNRLVRWLFHLGFWPASFPVWIWPVLIIAVGRNLFPQTSDSQRLLVWIIWVGWWSAIRLARQIEMKVRTIESSLLEACEVQGGSRVQQFRLVIRPIINRDLRETLLLSTAILIFDPTPALFGQVQNWPASKVVKLMLESSGPGLYQAAAWLVLMGLLMLSLAGVIKAIVGKRSVVTDEIAVSKQAYQTRRHTLLTFKTLAAVFSIWPILLLACIAVMQLGEWNDLILMKQFNELQIPVNLVTTTIWLILVSIFSSFLLNNGKILRGLGESYTLLIEFQPLLLPAFALTAIWQWGGFWETGNSWLNVAVFCQLIYMITITVFALTIVAKNQSGLSFKLTENVSRRLLMETALTLGASPLKARRVAGIDRSSRSSVSCVAGIFENAWWLAAAPAWLVVSPLHFSGLLPIAVLFQPEIQLVGLNSIYGLLAILLPGLLARVVAKFNY